MTIEKMKTLSDEELKAVSLKKNKAGNYTAEANRAMRIRRERAGHWEGISNKPPTYDEMWDDYNGYDVSLQ